MIPNRIIPVRGIISKWAITGQTASEAGLKKGDIPEGLGPVSAGEKRQQAGQVSQRFRIDLNDYRQFHSKRCQPDDKFERLQPIPAVGWEADSAPFYALQEYRKIGS